MYQDNSKTELVSVGLRQWFVVSCCFSIELLCIRIAATGHLTYVFLLWNLFLAIVPYGIAYWLDHNISFVTAKWKFAGAIIAWLLFVPNSFYILTDLFHLHEMSSAPKWFDLLLLISFAWNGLFMGIASLYRMETILSKASGRSVSVLIIFLVMLLNAYGIYIGRFLHYNSWDVVAQPISLFGQLLEMFIHPFQNIKEWGMIFCYAVFMTLLYMTLKKMADGFAHTSKHQVQINKQFH